jgi:PST family polysaccharide transporter
MPIGTERLLKGLTQHAEIARNAAWLSGGRIVQMGIGLLLAGWVGRYLQPEGYGTYCYAISFISLFTPLAYVGLAEIVVRELVRHPGRSGALLGTSLGLRLMGAALAVTSAIILGFYMGSHSALQSWMIAIASGSMLFRSLNVIDLWFQSRTESKYVAWADLTGFAVRGTAVGCLILFRQSALWFAGAYAVEAASAFLIRYLLYSRHGGKSASWSWNTRMASSLLRQSWWLALSALGSLVYLRIDQVMLGAMQGSREVGLYAAAIKWPEASLFVPQFICVSAFPMLVRTRQVDQDRYRRSLETLFALLIWMALALSAAGALLARPLVTWLFGADYAPAAPILTVHIWSSVFTFAGTLLSRWLLNEGFLAFFLLRNLLGAVVNVFLNIWLIPRWGGMGAAVATIISYSVASYFCCFFWHKTRPVGLMMTRALLNPFGMREPSSA